MSSRVPYLSGRRKYSPSFLGVCPSDGGHFCRKPSLFLCSPLLPSSLQSHYPTWAISILLYFCQASGSPLERFLLSLSTGHSLPSFPGSASVRLCWRRKEGTKCPTFRSTGWQGSQLVSGQLPWILIRGEGHPRRLGWMGFREGFLEEVTPDLS